MPRLRRGEPVLAFTFGVSISGALVLSALFWPKLAATEWLSLEIRVWVVIGYLTVFASVATFSLIVFATSRLPSAKVTAYTFLVPFWVACLEVMLGHGLPGVIVLAGGLPILAALVLLFFERT